MAGRITVIVTSGRSVAQEPPGAERLYTRFEKCLNVEGYGLDKVARADRPQYYRCRGFHRQCAATTRWSPWRSHDHCSRRTRRGTEVVAVGTT